MESLGALVSGISVGLLLAILVGPIFLALMSITITQGPKKAYWFMAGNATSDLIFAILAYHGLILWHSAQKGAGVWISLLAGVLFVTYGIYMFLKRDKSKDISIDTQGEKRHRKNIALWARGFIMNSSNPVMFIFRMSILERYVSNRIHHHPISYVIIFLFGVLATFIITDIIKIRSAHAILKKLTITNMDTVHKIAGAILVIVGMRFLGHGIFPLIHTLFIRPLP